MPAFISSTSFLSRTTLQRRSNNPYTNRLTMNTTSPSPSSPSPAATSTSRLTLYSTKLSNYGARVRYLARRKNLPESLFSVELPAVLGGSKSDLYLQKNPLGKIPLLLIAPDDKDGGQEMALFESAVICDFIAESYPEYPPTFIASTLEKRTLARLIVTVVDTYIGPYHQYMYRAVDGPREPEIEKMMKGFDVLEHVLHTTGPFAAGDELTVADCVLLGNFAFYDYMLPTFFACSALDNRPKLARWRKAIFAESDAAREVYLEVFEALHGWWDSGRWTDKLGMTPLTPRPEPSV